MPPTIARIALAGAALVAIAATASQMRPLAMAEAPVVQRVLSPPPPPPPTWEDSTAARAPWATASPTEALESPQFEADRRAFAEDLMRAGRIDAARADSLATYAVREAYQRRVPPALVFGVLMAENKALASSARSGVGAVGLMQVDQKVWVRLLGRRFGTDLRDDETNLRYGVFILSHLVYGGVSGDAPHADSTVRRGLLRYNGCVRGTNTRSCHRYPDVVRKRVEELALSQCGDLGYTGCVEQPMRLSLDDQSVRD